MRENIHPKNIEGKCPQCCCGGNQHHEGCGGRWHEMIVDDTLEDGWIHNYRCDKCLKKDYCFGYEDCEIDFE